MVGRAGIEPATLCLKGVLLGVENKALIDSKGLRLPTSPYNPLQIRPHPAPIRPQNLRARISSQDVSLGRLGRSRQPLPIHIARVRCRGEAAGCC